MARTLRTFFSEEVEMELGLERWAIVGLEAELKTQR